MGVKRILYLVRKIDLDVTKIAMQKVVKLCTQCHSSNPSSNTYDPGEIQVTTKWMRQAIDVMHYRRKLYLMMVDRGLGWIVIWKEVRPEIAIIIVEVLNEIFLK